MTGTNNAEEADESLFLADKSEEEASVEYISENQLTQGGEVDELTGSELLDATEDSQQEISSEFVLENVIGMISN